MNNRIMISLIAAVAENNVIGIRGQLPWHLPKDFAWFKSCTSGKPIIMGRKTFESLERPLPKRLNIIISRNPPDVTPQNDVIWVTSLEQAFDVARDHSANWGREFMVIGGGEIYAQALPLADRLYLTEVACAPAEGDAHFPMFDKTKWQRIVLQSHPADENRPAFSVVQYDRITHKMA